MSTLLQTSGSVKVILWLAPDLLSAGGYNKKVLNISLGIRHYLHKVKELEDVAKAGDRYNYETQKYFTLYIRSR